MRGKELTSVFRQKGVLYWLLVTCLCMPIIGMKIELYHILEEYQENAIFGRALHEKFVGTNAAQMRLRDITDFEWQLVCFHPDFKTVQRLEFRNARGGVIYNLDVTAYDGFDATLIKLPTRCLTKDEAVLKKVKDIFYLDTYNVK